MTRYIAHVHRPGWTRRQDWTEGPGIIHRDLVYGQAITGHPFAEAILEEMPLTAQEDDWIRWTLATFIAPGGKITEAWKLPLVPVRQLIHTIEGTYSDIPGAHDFTVEQLSQALQERMAAIHGEEFAARAAENITWTITHPPYPGGHTKLRGAVEVSTLGAA
ncbi:hypothetical protein SEA_SONALI_82 [Arthrobacter phage Sonali]|uniref:Uncharacterized protein n=1 Tax=Arthrobacter phage Sonali TaxID=2510495 RepID=A0A411CQJ7_9CAUD|nr:hypothetical protein HOV09_gp82 [Arthrobacter phage Sonali]QAY16194.1 hypothetical protein SEA_SONALI_82 [Arthrobacter phage Sonali]